MARDGFKEWRMGLPEDSPALRDLLEYGREMGMQPAETARVIIVEWSRALRGRTAFGGAMTPQFVSAPPQADAPTTKPKGSEANVERERAKARGARFASVLDMDDE